MPTKREFENMPDWRLVGWCRWLIEHPFCSAIAADQARGLIADTKLLENSSDFAVPHPLRGGTTIGEARAESLRRRMISFLAASL
jgi:hypothetical protein